MAWVGFLITVWSQWAMAQSANDAWTLTALKAQSVPAVWLLEGSDFVRQKPAEGEGFIEIQGRLNVAPGTRFEPVALAEIRLRSAMASAAERPRSAFSVGSSIAMCRYLSPDLRGRDMAKMAVGDDRYIAISRASPTAPLKFEADGANIDLCIAVPAKGRIGDSLVLEFAGQAYPVVLSEAGNPLPAIRSEADSRDGLLRVLTWRNLAMGFAGVLLVVLTGGGVWWWRRRRAAATPPQLPSTADYPGAEAAPSVGHPEEAAIDPASPPAISSPVLQNTVEAKHAPALPAAAPVSPRRVAAVHCRTTFVRVGSNTGPGKADFEAGLRLLQAERHAEAEARLAAGIDKGLPPTFACGAWSLRGQAAINQGKIPEAIDYFLNALGSPEVTSQAALPAALYLEVIYRTLGLRADADKMKAVAKAINGFDITVEPLAGKRLQEKTRAYAKALRAAEPSLLKRLRGRFLKR